MYNKLFTKILDSSVWLESASTRIVWLTLLAAMDEDSFCRFAAVANLAHRARVSEKDAAAAVKILESPDPNSSNPANEGRRIERVQGGWIVLNGGEHREMVTRAVQREQTRDRVRRYRQRKANAPVTHSNESVTESNRSEAVSEAHTETDSKAQTKDQDLSRLRARAETVYPIDFLQFWDAYPKKTGKGEALKAWTKAQPPLVVVLTALTWQKDSDQWNRDNGQYRPNPATYLNQRRWEDEPPAPASYVPDPHTKEGRMILAARRAESGAPRINPFTGKAMSDGQR